MKRRSWWSQRSAGAIVSVCLLHAVAQAAEATTASAGVGSQPPAESTVSHTAAQIAALNSLDAALARFDADLARVSDVGERARVKALLDVFKTRRDAMRKARFDQVRYDELRFDLNVEYQRLGQFLAPPKTPSHGATPRSARIVVPELDLVMLPLAAGTFVMGQPQGTASNSPDESPPTRVVFTKPFWLGATEVTVGQWRHFATATSYRTDAEESGGLFVAKDTAEGAMAGWEQRAGLNWQNPGRPQEDRQPVVGISWNDAVAFCAWLTEREKKSGRLPAGYAYALPTEAQWEYACRAGNRGPDPEDLDALAWHAGNSAGALHPVGMKQPNLWGFFDLQGNVAEWCFDWYGPYPGGTVTDPTGPREGTVRVNRGGSARSAAGYGISATNRGSNPAPPQRDDLGFRVALTPVR